MLPFNMGAGGASGVDTGDIPASLRFRGAASAYLSRTFGTPTDNKKWTWSGWVKRGQLSAAAYTLFSGGTSGSNDASLLLDANGSLWLYYWTGSYVFSAVASAFCRDPTGHVHLVVAYDSTQAQSAHSASDSRIRFYVNGTQVPSTGTLPSQNYASNQINTAVAHRVGYTVASVYPFDGYLSRIAFIDSQALTPSSFGYFNTEINEWVSKSQSAVKAVVDAGGTNSFMLDFDDGTSLTTLGYDKSRKGNNWTLNNFSLTAGTSYDWMLDVPGNSFATLNPLSHTSVTETNGNLTTSSFSLDAWSIGTLSASTGKWYAEIAMTAFTVAEPLEVGVTRGNSMRSGGAWTTGATLMNNAVVYDYGGNKRVLGSSSAYGATWTTNDVIGIAFDIDGGTVTFYKNGVSQGAISQSLSGYEWAVVVANQRGGGCTCTVSLHNGAAPLHASATYDSAYFCYTPPAGYKALCQRNLPDPAILNPEKHFDIRTRTGDAASPKVLMSDLLFSPDFIWTKDRNTGYQHTLQDRVRGTGPSGKLYSSLTEAEGGANSVYGYISSFDSAGVTATVGSGGFQHINANAVTYVDWLWKAGGAAVTNNAGSISSQVSANIEAGVSIVTYTGNLSSAGTATVGHGLGQAPGLIISKSRNNAGGDTGQWVARHKYLASANHYLRLNTTDTPVDSSANGSMSASTSTVFSTNWTSGMNSNGGNFVAYCFAEIPGFSKIFSYTGNGAADGPFVHCGFKPKYVLIKNISAAFDWWIYNTVSNTYNPLNLALSPNSSGAEVSTTGYNDIDATGSGFKLRGSHQHTNYSGYQYIGIAFADVPAKYSLAR